jgi:predicted aspartyl protease
MMIDTGNASSLLRPSVARKLGLRCTGSLEQVTAAGVRRVPAALLDEVRAGNVIDKLVEVMVADVEVSGVDGVLGQSWLLRHDYLLDYRHRRLVLNATPPAGGVKALLRSSDGRPAILAEVDNRRQELLVDSGAQLLVLYEHGVVVAQARLLTNGEPAPAEICSAKVAIGPNYFRKMTAAKVNPSSQTLGLLPAAAFGSVYVSNRDGVVVLIP